MSQTEIIMNQRMDDMQEQIVLRPLTLDAARYNSIERTNAKTINSEVHADLTWRQVACIYDILRFLLLDISTAGKWRTW